MKRCIIGLILMPALLAAEPVWNEGEHGLWRLQFVDGTFLSVADVATNACAGHPSGVRNARFGFFAGSPSGSEPSGSHRTILPSASAKMPSVP